ncbi:MAG: hypothetical protein Q3960_03560 [Lactobacillus sp.]|nr:hypothetical protein [Lactobacillus sp.]
MAEAKFVMVRCFMGIYFFFNFVWSIALFVGNSSFWIVPAMVTILSLTAIFEQIDLKKHEQLKLTKYFLIVQLLVNLLILIANLNSSIFSLLFPFMKTTGLLTIQTINLLGATIAISLFLKIKKGSRI